MTARAILPDRSFSFLAFLVSNPLLTHNVGTTSGNFNDAAFRCTLEVFDNDKVYFCADYPFERMEEAAEWFDATDIISDEQRQKMGRDNAQNLLGL